MSLKKLLLGHTNIPITKIFNTEVISVNVETSAEDVAIIMQKYDLVVLPVVDNIGRLVGRITIDDVVDFIKEEADKDYQMASGISQDVEASDSAWKLTKARIPWLVIGLVGGVLGSRVISLFQEDIRIRPEMAFFIQLIAATAGNVGIQSSAIIVQSIANNTLGLESVSQKLFKELLVAILNGLLLTSVLLTYNLFFSSSYALTFTVSLALFSVIIFAAIFGTIIPLILNKFKIDPALATGPFITTTNDIIGVLIYFSIGHLMYDLF